MVYKINNTPLDGLSLKEAKKLLDAAKDKVDIVVKRDTYKAAQPAHLRRKNGSKNGSRNMWFLSQNEKYFYVYPYHTILLSSLIVRVAHLRLIGIFEEKYSEKRKVVFDRGNSSGSSSTKMTTEDNTSWDDDKLTPTISRSQDWFGLLKCCRYHSNPSGSTGDTPISYLVNTTTLHTNNGNWRGGIHIRSGDQKLTSKKHVLGRR